MELAVKYNLLKYAENEESPDSKKHLQLWRIYNCNQFKNSLSLNLFWPLKDSVPTWVTNSGKSNQTKKRKIFDEDSYFDDDEDDPPPPKEAQYDPFNPTGEAASNKAPDDDEVDPLDAFMMENAKEVAKDVKTTSS